MIESRTRPLLIASGCGAAAYAVSVGCLCPDRPAFAILIAALSVPIAAISQRVAAPALRNVIAVGAGSLLGAAGSQAFLGVLRTPEGAVLGAVGAGAVSVIFSCIWPRSLPADAHRSATPRPPTKLIGNILLATGLVLGTSTVFVGLVILEYLAGHVHRLDVVEQAVKVGIVGAIASGIVAGFWILGQAIRRHE